MTVVPALTNDYSQNALYVRLGKGEAAGTDCLSKVNSFTSVAESLADLVIAGPFRNYTLHNRGHAKKILHLLQYIIPAEVVDTLEPLECLLLIYAAFLHDLGLALTSHEREEIVASEEFQDHCREWPELWSRLSQARLRLTHLQQDLPAAAEILRLQIESQIYQLHEAALCSLMRPKHATEERYRALIKQITSSSGRTDLFEYQAISFVDTLIQICVSHNQDVAILAEVTGPYDERFPRRRVFGGQSVNIQFCAALLRLADILDFDRERTPRILFESLDIGESTMPGAEVSLGEWQKHMAIHSLEIRPDEIVVYGECTHPVIEKSIREFSHAIERELRDTQAVLRHNTREIQDKYYLNLPISVRPKIVSRGYIYKDLSLQMNQAAITSLLMGDRLYSNPCVAIRELVQNAIDAVAARKLLDASGTITPRIHVKSLVSQRYSNRFNWLSASMSLVS